MPIECQMGWLHIIHFWFPVSTLLILVRRMNVEQCGSWSTNFTRNQLIRIYTVFKEFRAFCKKSICTRCACYLVVVEHGEHLIIVLNATLRYWGLDKTNKFQRKIVKYFLIHNFSICFVCSKEPSHWDRLIETVLLSTHNICFGWEIR